jgi:uncharacterized protein DUF2510
LDSTEIPSPSEGWFPDPTGRHEKRWWDGQSWGDWIADAGSVGEDPLTPAPAVPVTAGEPAPATPAEAFPVTAAAAAAESGPGRHRNRRLQVFALAAVAALIAAVAVVVVQRGDDDSGNDSNPAGDAGAENIDPASADDPAAVFAPASVQQTIDEQGGVIEVGVSTDGTDGADGTGSDSISRDIISLEFPPGAVSADTDISVTVSPGVGGPLADLVGEASALRSISDLAFDEDYPQLHPVFGAIAALDNIVMSGPMLEFGPDGSEFEAPAEMRVPLDLVGLAPGDAPIVVLGDGDDWEAVAGVTIDADRGVLVIPVNHFSTGFIGRILSNIWSNPFARTEHGRYRQALETLGRGPLDDVVNDISRAALCPDNTNFDASAVPDLSDVLNYLGFESARISTAPSGAGTRIQDQLRQRFDQARAAGNSAPNDVGFDELMTWAMNETANDPFQALVLAHDVLRDNRDSPSIQGAMTNVRGDGGDERGGRYHLLGTAIYAFAYEHQRATGNLGWFDVSPNMASVLEEAWVSGDINTDTVEYAVDRRGARLGRQLYRDYTSRQAGTSTGDLFLDCASLSTSTSSTTSTTTTSTVPPDLDLGTGDVQVTLLWSGDSDMDLHVIDPAGEEIWFSSTSSSSGGELDYDVIPDCGFGGANAENVFWPVDGAPAGPYRASVVFYDDCGSTTTSVQMTISVNGQLVSSTSFTLSTGGQSAWVDFAVG